jgi:hypothetical protein
VTRTWGEWYRMALARGWDHGYAAHWADQRMKAQEKKATPPHEP